MFVDTTQSGGGGEPWVRSCQSCRAVIPAGEHFEQVRFSDADEEALRKLNGDYHVACAAPILSAKRAYDMLKRFPGF